MCTKCHEVKPLTSFYKQSKCKDGYRPDCKTCKKSHSQTRRDSLVAQFGKSDFRKYVERYHDLETAARKKAERAAIFRQWIDAVKEATPCTDCANFFPAVCMDFDHLPGFKKKLGIAQMVQTGYSRELILEEITKCDLVCANCHRIRTWKSGRDMPWYEKNRKYDRSTWA